MIVGPPPKAPSFLVTDPCLLQVTIQKAEERGAKSLVLIASGSLTDLLFHVGDGVSDLKICRCGYDKNVQDYLKVQGTCTFNKTFLQEWQEQPDNTKRLILGPGVIIEVIPNMSSGWELPQESFEYSKQEKVSKSVEQMIQTSMDGNWWEQWKAPMAAILGSLSGAARFAATMNLTAGGAFVQYKFLGSQLAVGTAALKASAALSGGCIVLGTGVAAAVYFIPWESFFEWLKQAFKWLMHKINELWTKVKEWLASCVSTLVRSAGRSKIITPLKV